jgi:hypothetical protein
MKFDLTPERRAELDPLFAELRKWIDDLEQLDLDRYDPVLDPSPRRRSGDDAAAND